MHLESPFRDDFPYLYQNNNDENIYFDSSATTLKPKCVIDAVSAFYTDHTANVSRAVHHNGQKTTELFEAARDKVALLIGAKPDEIVFNYNCTDALNFLANSLGLVESDEIILSIVEHNSVYLPFAQKGKVKLLGLQNNGQINCDELRAIINANTKLIVINHVSNVTGCIQPVLDVVTIAKAYNVTVVLDMSQSVAHLPVNVKELDCDFAVFSGHKMLGPSGVGVLYGKKDKLEMLLRYRTGGGAVEKVTLESVRFRPVPQGLEPGTPNIEGVIGLGQAANYLISKSKSVIHGYLMKLKSHFIHRLQEFKSTVELIHPYDELSLPIFTLAFKNKDLDTNEVANILSQTYRIAVNSGVQCAHLYYGWLHRSGGLRVSLYIYNTVHEIDVFFNALNDLEFILKGEIHNEKRKRCKQ